MVKNTLISTSPVFLPGISFAIFCRNSLVRGENMHVRQPVRQQLGPGADGLKIGPVAHIKAVAALGEYMCLYRDFCSPIFFQQADDGCGAAFIIIGSDETGGRAVWADFSGNAEGTGINQQLEI